MVHTTTESTVMFRRTFLKSLFGAALALPAATQGVGNAPRKLLILQRSPIAGFQYHDGESVWHRLSPGDPLHLTREPDNPRDQRAVAVHWHDAKLGYIPRTDNCAVSQLLDRGQPVRARIRSLNKSNDPWQRITLELFVPITT